MSKRIELAAGLILAFASSRPAGAFLAVEQPIEVSFEVVANSVDGTTRSACHSAAERPQYSQERWWFAIAGAETNGEGGARGASIRCGTGPQSSRGGAEADAAPALLIGEVSSRLRPVRQMEDEVVLEVSLELTLRAVPPSLPGAGSLPPESRLVRELAFANDGEVFVPLLVTEPGGSLGLRELFLRVAARRHRDESLEVHGALSVIGGANEAELLLDGSAVGKSRPGAETLLSNMPVGRRQLVAREADGREMRRAIEVEGGRVAQVVLTPPERGAGHYRLAPLGTNAQGFEEYRRGADGAVVVRIPAGEFLMGNQHIERGTIERSVYLSEFLMDKTAVTWAQYRRFADRTGVPLPLQRPYWGIHEDHPVVYVAWETAQAYCAWAGGRLPTEAEREKAARGTDGRTYPWGDDEPTPERAVFRRSWGHAATDAVGTHPAGASPYGLQDMAGNVWEWTADWFDENYYARAPQRDPRGPTEGRARVVRGGSWDSRPSVLATSYRSFGHRGYREGDFGFRCAMRSPRR